MNDKAGPHTQAAHEKCGGECEVARLLVCLDESRKMVREEAAKAQVLMRSMLVVEDSAWRQGCPRCGYRPPESP